METTTRAQHTPGPWDIVRRPIGPNTETSQWRVYSQHGIEIAESPVGPEAFNVANARLIAAAPALLAALEEVENGITVGYERGIEESIDWPHYLTIIRAAIAQARGDA